MPAPRVLRTAIGTYGTATPSGSRTVQSTPSGYRRYPERNFVAEGGLIDYGANTYDLYDRAATYVDKILKGMSGRTYRSSSRRRSTS